MLIGYARTSTLDQEAGFEAQKRDLAAAGCEKIFAEQVSSVSEYRAELATALEFVREGDALIVTKLDRLARSMQDLMKIVETVHRKKAALRILNMNLDTGTPTGRLMLNLLGSIAQWEREMMLERQREGVERAKAAGKYKGRVPTARRRAAEVMALKAQGVGPAETARRLGISRQSVYRILDEKAA